MSGQLSNKDIISKTVEWLEKAVIGLNLCPFAKPVHVKKQIRYMVSEAETEELLLQDLKNELLFLSQADIYITETTLLIHPKVLTDFLDYNDFLYLADSILNQLGLEGELQIASFHPEYQFVGSEPQDIENYTNRSPYPMLHLIREVSIDKALESFPDAEEIPKRNQATMRKLGHNGWKKLFT